jgi:myo-inositol-1(or 4)-monophosphatase
VIPPQPDVVAAEHVGEPGAPVVDAGLLDELLAVANAAAAAAVDLIHHRRPDDFGVQNKSTPTDMVTEMDTASERLIRAVIAGHRPDDVVVGEEGGRLGDEHADGDDADDAERITWWVDPIDGTTNYVYDHPGYNVSIAAARGGTTLVGVVADPTHGRTYSAAAGRGAFCNGRRLRLGDAAPLDRALVATGFAYDPARRARQGAVLARVVPQVRDIRRMGAAALDLCSVAAGRVDAYYEVGLARWDLAAGALVASEAGARLGSIGGGPLQPASVLAAHPERFDELSELLMASGAADM